MPLLLVLLLFLLFVLPNPAGAGATVGNAFDSLVAFARTTTNEATASLSTSGSTGNGSGTVARTPTGGVAAGDGTRQVASHRTEAPVVVPSDGASPDLGGEATLPYSAPVRLSIPALGVTTGFVRLGLEPDGTMEVPPSARTAGWYGYGPTPGQKGPAVVAAHVDWMQQAGVFADLGRMRPGDEVAVARSDRSTVVFRVTRTAQYAKSQFPTREVYGHTDDAELRLISCGGRFDPATRSYDDNVVVYARMTRVT